MPSIPTGRYNLEWGWDPGEDGWGQPMNDNLAKLAAYGQLVIKSFDFASPPVGYANWEVYRVGNAATGEWQGHTGELAVFAGKWLFQSPERGFRAWSLQHDDACYYDGAIWRYETSREPLLTGSSRRNALGVKAAWSAPGTPFAGDVWPLVLDEEVWLTQAGRHRASCEKSPVDAMIIGVLKNDLEVGRIRFSSGAFTGAFTIAEDVRFVDGDRVKLVMPLRVDENWRDISVSLRLTFTGAD